MLHLCKCQILIIDTIIQCSPKACTGNHFGASCELDCNCDGTCDRVNGCGGTCSDSYEGNFCQGKLQRVFRDRPYQLFDFNVI